MKRNSEEIPTNDLLKRQKTENENQVETDNLFEKIKAIHTINGEIVERITHKQGKAIVLCYSYQVKQPSFNLTENKWSRQASSIIAEWTPKNKTLEPVDACNLFQIPQVKQFEDLPPLNNKLFEISTYLRKFGSSEEGSRDMRILLSNIELVQEFLGQIEGSLIEPPSRLEEYRQSFNLQQFKQELESQILSHAFPQFTLEDAKYQLQLKFPKIPFEEAFSKQFNLFVSRCNRHFIPIAGTDEDGLFYWLGTQSSHKYKNPVTSGIVKVSASDTLKTDEEYIFSRDEEQLIWRKGSDSVWVTFDLGRKKVFRCTDYTMVHGPCLSSHKTFSSTFRNWRLEGSNDKTNWKLIHRHAHSFMQGDEVMLTKVPPGSDDFFRYFRLVLYPSITFPSLFALEGGYAAVRLADVEFYGELAFL